MTAAIPEQIIWTIHETADGGRTIHTWEATADQLAELRRWLGEPDVETLASPELIAHANAASEQAIHLFKETP